MKTPDLLGITLRAKGEPAGGSIELSRIWLACLREGWLHNHAVIIIAAMTNQRKESNGMTTILMAKGVLSILMKEGKTNERNMAYR